MMTVSRPGQIELRHGTGVAKGREKTSPALSRAEGSGSNAGPVWFSRRFGTLESRNRDLDTDFSFEFKPSDRCGHSARLACVDDGAVRIARVWDAGGVTMDGAAEDNALVAFFMWGEELEVDGAKQAAPRLVVLGPETEIRTRQPGEYRFLRIGLRGAAFERFAERASGPRRPCFTRPGVHRPPLAAADELKLQEILVRATALADRAAAKGTVLRKAMELAVADARSALTSLLSDSVAAEPRPAHAPAREKLVRAALDFLDAHPFEPVAVADVCESLGVTERSLQRAFSDCLGTSLRTYERERRLRAVHGAILAEGDTRSITDIALGFGFWHLGRFSAAYAAMFGCLPTETRRRVCASVPCDADERGRSQRLAA